MDTFYQIDWCIFFRFCMNHIDYIKIWKLVCPLITIILVESHPSWKRVNEQKYQTFVYNKDGTKINVLIIGLPCEHVIRWHFFLLNYYFRSFSHKPQVPIIWNLMAECVRIVSKFYATHLLFLGVSMVPNHPSCPFKLMKNLSCPSLKSVPENFGLCKAGLIVEQSWALGRDDVLPIWPNQKNYTAFI